MKARRPPYAHPMSVARRAFMILAGLALALATLQFFLAGVGAFGAGSYEAHRVGGQVAQALALLLLIAGAAGRLGRPAIIFGGGLLVISVVMGLLANAGDWAGAVHPLLAIAFWFGAFQAFSWARTGAPLVDSPATQ